jgi:hypothetical protein
MEPVRRQMKLSASNIIGRSPGNATGSPDYVCKSVAAVVTPAIRWPLLGAASAEGEFRQP